MINGMFNPINLCRTDLQGSAVAQEAKEAASRAQARASEIYLDSRSLSADVERLFMITEALWMMLKEKHGYTDEQLVEQIYNIDLRDGELDGKIAKSPPKSCPGCNRTMQGNRPICIYCGEVISVQPFER